MEDLFKVLVEVRILGDYQVVFEDSLDEILAAQEIFKLLEVDGILGSLRLESVDECLQLVMSINTTLLDVVENLMLKEVSSVLRVQCLKGTACP